ncbi:formate dehydrogenase subunit gamma [Chloroflexota bacterium]
MTHHEVEKYRKPVRVLHWVHTSAFVLLFLTGLVLFIPQLGMIAQDSWTRLIHRIVAIVFVIAPIIYLTMDWKRSWRGIKQAFTWGNEDIGWLKAAPRYYFLGDESAMPPQGSMNTGQKMWWFIVIVFGVLFVITGLIMWFAKTTAPPALLQWMVLLHDISFIVSGAMLFVHIYLGVFHPLMTEALGSMKSGKISVEYAKKHHSKWYNEVSKTKEEPAK